MNKIKEDAITRCTWCAGGGALYTQYHDKEWGVPLYDSQKLFECILLDGAQAGLSWLTILKRREGYRAAFENFNAEKIARYGEADRKRLLSDQRIIRNRLKIEAAIINAQGYLAFMEGPLSFADWLWQFTGGVPIINHWNTMEEIPVSTALSHTISAELKKRGWKFVGPVIIYAFMQAAGLVNDHLACCFRWDILRRQQPSFSSKSG